MYRQDLGVYLSVISARRPHEVPRMSQLVGPATWYVADGEKLDYVMVGAPVVVESGGLVQARNEALQDAFRMNLPCVQLSDDMRTLKAAYVLGDGRTYGKDITFVQAIAKMHDWQKQYPEAHLTGVAPTASTLNFNKERPVSKQAFVVGDFIMVQPTSLMFDEAFDLKEDYDYTCQHLDRYGIALRCNDLLIAFQHGINAGGAVAYRSGEREQRAIQRLKEKWPGVFRDNSRRPNEVLMRWEGREQVA